MTAELKPCPWCHDDGAFEAGIGDERGYWYAVICRQDECCYSPRRRSKAEAIAAWNRRPQPEAVSDELRDAYDDGYLNGSRATEARLFARMEQLEAALRAVMPFLEDCVDSGPPGEGWQSKELVRAINGARDALGGGDE